MKLILKNLGAIQQTSEIDLEKRLMMFVGYNNSGKTYVSQLVWYIFRELRNDLKLENYITEKDIEEDFKNFELDIEPIIQNFQSILKEKGLDFLGLTDKNTILELKDTFFEKEYKFGLSFLHNNKVAYEVVKNANSFILNIGKKLENSDIKLYSAQFIALKHSQDWIRTTLSFNDINLVGLNNFINDCIWTIFSIVVKDNYQNLTFLPATRSFLPSYYKYLVDGFVKERKEISESIRKNPENIEKIKQLSRKRHTSAADDLLDKLNDLSKNSFINKTYTDLIKDLENIMQGSILVENFEGIAFPEFAFKIDEKTNLEMYQTSTSVNQLTMLYLYLKYWTEASHNFLIMDEPEENLHPENQIKLLDILVKFADRDNNRVLITTHSPLMAKALNNHIHISYLQENKIADIEKIIHENNLSISPNHLGSQDYGVYFFDGEKVRNYQMTDFGVFFKDFKEAENKVNDTSNILKSIIHESKS